MFPRWGKVYEAIHTGKMDASKMPFPNLREDELFSML